MKTISYSFFLFSIIFMSSCGETDDDDTTYTLITTVSPKEGGSITSSDEEFEKRTGVTLQADANEGWRFVRWEGDLDMSSPEVNLRMNQNYTVVGIFEQDDEHGDWPRDSDTEVVEVTSTTGRVWMDRNLGARRAATSSTDSQAYGDLYQWGRAADGHQLRNSPTTSILSNSDQPGHGSFILAPDSPFDWRSPQNNNLWQGVNGINNPCPAGYRLPTDAEWEAERNSLSSNNTTGAYSSPLKLPLAGDRSSSSGTFFDIGSVGFYWSSTVFGSFIYGRGMNFVSNNASMYSSLRAIGHPVRCIKD